MKRLPVLLVGAVLLISCDSPVEPGHTLPTEPAQPPFLDQHPAGSVDTVFGPEVFAVGRTWSLDATREFAVELEQFEGPFTVRLENGDDRGLNRVTVAYVLLNGKPVFQLRDFLWWKPSLSATVELAENSRLRVGLAGLPGRQFRLWIEGGLKPGRARIGPEGGSATSGDGLLTVTLPPGAIDAPRALLAIEPVPHHPVPGDAWLPVSTDYSISLSGAALRVPATLEWRLPDQDQDGYLDGTDAPTSAVVVRSRPDPDSPWSVTSDQHLDLTAATAIAQTSELSIWSLAVSHLMSCNGEGSSVHICGGQFYSDGRPFSVRGANTYGLGQPDNKQFVDAVLQAARDLDLNVVRVWAFEGVADIASLKYVLDRAEHFQLKVILALVNNWNDFSTGTMDWYVRQGGGTNHGDFFVGGAGPDGLFRDWVKTVVPALRDKPAIFAWEIANEPRCSSDDMKNEHLPDGGPSCLLSSLPSWALRTGALIREEDGEHLIAAGDEGALSAYLSFTDVGSIDFLTQHLYDVPLSDGLELIANYERIAAHRRKAYLLEEFGLRRPFFNNWSEACAIKVSVYHAWAASAPNWMFWHLAERTSGQYDDDAIYPPDPVTAAFGYPDAEPCPASTWCNTSLEFSSSTLPSGWTLVPFGSGPFFANGHLQSPPYGSQLNVPRIDAAGPLPAGTQEVVVEYDGNLAPTGAPQSEGRGQGRVISFVMANGWSIEAQEFNDRYGVNVHSFRAQTNIPQWPEPGWAWTIFDIASTSGVPYDQYHFTAVFRDGQVTWNGSRGGTQTMGPFVQPLTGFALSEVRSFSLGVGSALAEAAWADNLIVRCR
jgi:hypothetical protein